LPYLFSNTDSNWNNILNLHTTRVNNWHELKPINRID
jgi:hypothetical protein